MSAQLSLSEPQQYVMPGLSLLSLLVNLHMPVQGGGVPPAVHILVHLLGDLLRVAEVRRCHGHPGK